MTDLATWITSRIPADRDLGREAAGALAIEIAAERSLWESHVTHDAETRFYRQLYRDPNVDVWLICWTNGQDTGYHDHDRSEGGVCVADGALFEDYFHRDDDGWIRERTNRHEAGSMFEFDASYIHGVRHADGAPAASIHVYSPALWRMGHYEPDPNGVMRRVAVTYADELLGVA